ncbi:MAG: aminotransferase class III-fold pyridoxal phosphate-dependent enzyme [Actinomycetota bacterium]|nr:aminotransferase class III-fold pyridoxal phosphate-dependent enzyme [Actinomycetota bacterium]MDQ2956881.1 aminotransferase class III-fold pyridoxal phosphate-dependent enzyme [Actinomycetota bacterium]
MYDSLGRRYLDGLSSLFCVQLGHGRSDICAAAVEQLQTLAYWTNWSACHPAAMRAADLIAERTPGDLNRIFFVNSGSEANEAAVKFARQLHFRRGDVQRTKIIARDLAYHGVTLGALALSGVEAYQAPFGVTLPGVLRIPNTKHLGTDLDNNLESLVSLIEAEGPETIAAILAEPVQNAGGVLVPPAGYWQRLREICDRYGLLLIADEVICGFGRIGEWFGTAKYNVVPDIITFAKGVTSGYAPLGGMAVKDLLVDEMADPVHPHVFSHGSTWGGHPVSTAVAAANILALESEGVLSTVKANEPYFANSLQELYGRYPQIAHWRGLGYLYAVELCVDRNRDRTRDRALGQAQREHLLRRLLPAEMRRTGMLTRADDRGGTFIVLAPPLTASRAELAEIFGCLDEVLRSVSGYLASV